MKRFVLLVSILATGVVASSSASLSITDDKQVAHAALHPCHIHCWDQYWSCAAACGDDQDCKAMCVEDRNSCLYDCNEYGY